MKPLGHMKVLTRAGCVASVVVCLAGCCLPTSPPGRFRGLLPPDARHLCVQGKEGGSAPHGAVMDEQFYHFFSLIARGVPCVEAGPASGLQERHAQRLCAEEKGRGAPSEALTQAVIRFFEAFRGASIRQCSRQTGASPGQVVAVMTAHGLGPPSTSAHTVQALAANGAFPAMPPVWPVYNATSPRPAASLGAATASRLPGTGAAGDCGVLLRAEPRAAGAARTSSSLRGLITPIAVSAGDDMALERSRGLGLNPCLRGLSYICGANPPVAVAFVPKVCLLPSGSGQLHLADKPMMGYYLQDSARVALSWAMLHEKAFRAAGFKILTSLRARTHDVMLAVTGPNNMDGASAGWLLALHMLQAMTDCLLDGRVTGTGSVSLGGMVNSVDGIREKVRCAAEMSGVSSMLLPEANRSDVVALRAQDRGELFMLYVNSMAQVVEHAVRRPARQLPAEPAGEGRFASTLVLVGEATLTLEACIIPGSGRVLLTCVQDGHTLPRTCLNQALAWLGPGGGQAQVLAMLQSRLGILRVPGLLVDLQGMRVTSLHPDALEYQHQQQQQEAAVRSPTEQVPAKSLDLHINLAGHSYAPVLTTGLGVGVYTSVQDGCMYGAPMVVALVSLMTGLAPRDPGLQVFGACLPDGLVSEGGNLTPTMLRKAKTDGCQRLLMGTRDYLHLEARLTRQQRQSSGTLPQVQPVNWLHEMVAAVFVG